MRYRELQPSPVLEPYVRCYWTLDAAGPGGPPQRVLPDGCVEIVINLGEPFQRFTQAACPERQPGLLLVGPTTRHMTIAPMGAIRLVGIRFRPGGASPFLDVAPHEIRDAAPALDDAVASLDASLAEQLDAARDGMEARVLDQALGGRLARSRRAGDERVRAAVRRTLASHHALRVDSLVAATGLGARQLERAFRDTVGFGPKTLCRLARFQRIVRALETPARPHWARLAAEHGYVDQPHLAREFREFAGTTLTSYLSELHPMSDRFHNGPVADVDDPAGALRVG